jgi:cytochrome d ubiquinol oxidase subunit II
VRAEARDLFDGLTSGAGLAAVIVSVLAGAITMYLVARERYAHARLSAAVAVAAIVIGWPLAQSPDFLPGLTLNEAAAGDATLVALLIAVAAGLLVLVPSLTWLFRLVLSGRFDEPLPAPREAPPAIRPWRAPPPAVFAALTVAGVALTFFTEGGAGRIVGVTCLVARSRTPSS